jgi:predicted N-acetyltransferase YhbS
MIFRKKRGYQASPTVPTCETGCRYRIERKVNVTAEGGWVRERVGGLRDRFDQLGVVDTYVRAFTDPVWMEDHVWQALFRPPLYDPAHTRVVVRDGRVVSAVTMAPRTSRFGPARVPAMTIGPVGTHERYRKKGYATLAMTDACRYMAENGILLAYLQGISDFYHRFGFYPFMAPSRLTIQRKKAEKEAAPATLRSMNRGDLPAVRRLYSRAAGDRICAAARDEKVWQWLTTSGTRTWLFRDPKVILDRRGKICAYFTHSHPRDMALGEIVVKADELSCRSALGALARRAKRKEQKKIVLPLPWNDYLAVFIRQQISTDFSLRTGSTGGALMKIVDFPKLMKRLEPLYSQRWNEASGTESAFLLRSEIGIVRVEASESGVRIEPFDASKVGIRGGVHSRAGVPVVEVQSRWLSGLLTGFHPAGELHRSKRISFPRGLLPVLEVLFPPRWPFVYQGDNY